MTVPPSKRAVTERRAPAIGPIPATCRAVVVESGEPHLVPARSVHSPQPGEAVVRLRRAAIGALDVEIARGLNGFSGVLGREFVGVVEAVNAVEARDLIGSRVTGSSELVCGQCDMCLTGLRSHCRTLRILGMLNADGCLAEYFTTPVSNLVAIPDSIPDEQAVFAPALAAALQCARQLTIVGKPYVTVLGDGPIGLLTAQVMARLNASVRVIGRYSEKLALCEKWGVKHRHVDDIGRRADQDVVIECTGTPSGIELAMQLVRPRGTIVLKTIVAPKPAIAPGVDLTPLALHEITLIGSRFGPVADAVGMIARGEVDTINLAGKRMKLADGPAILRNAARPGAMPALVEP